MAIVRERIQAARAKKGISQKKMAEFLGISQPGYSQIESGKYPDMRVSTLVSICEILDVSTDWILGFVDRDPDLNTESFYMDIIDNIWSCEEDGLIDYEAADTITKRVDSLKSKYDILV